MEEHYVTTKDGFILNLQRIPHGKNNSTSGSSKPVVFLQHGLTMDSTNWVLNGPSGSLGYILADRGFDVWLGNIRGNQYSQKHVKLDQSEDDFWDWRYTTYATLSSGILRNIPRVTCIFPVNTRAFRRVCIRRKYK